MKQPLGLVRALALVPVLPVPVAYVQSLAPRSLAVQARAGTPMVFVTDRSAPREVLAPYVIDFIDDLGGASLRRAQGGGRILSRLLQWDAQRLRRLDARLATNAALAVAVSEHDAHAISPAVKAIRHAIGTAVVPGPPSKLEGKGKVVFTGNLFYPPNLEAALWICESLVPALKSRGVEASQIIVAGRRPPKPLQRKAATAGVDLQPDVADLNDVLREAAVVLAPVVMGSGVQSKVLDAVGAGRPCVITPFANNAIGLQDGVSVLERDRSPAAFSEAILSLLEDPAFGRRLAERARASPALRGGRGDTRLA
ncbi:MAG: hypothetical protein NVSMB32_15720 [Actinomycetota bacterium]